MGTVISDSAVNRIESMIGQSEGEGAEVVVDGRDFSVDGYENGAWVGPTLIAECSRTRSWQPKKSSVQFCR